MDDERKIFQTIIFTHESFNIFNEQFFLIIFIKKNAYNISHDFYLAKKKEKDRFLIKIFNKIHVTSPRSWIEHREVLTRFLSFFFILDLIISNDAYLYTYLYTTEFRVLEFGNSQFLKKMDRRRREHRIE